MLTWDESKRRPNIRSHGLDFVRCDAIWGHFTVTREDKRQDYGEARQVCFGLLAGEVVVMVYTKRPRGAHVISLRKAEKHEARYYRQVAKDYLGQGTRPRQPRMDRRHAWRASTQMWARATSHANQGTDLYSPGCRCIGVLQIGERWIPVPNQRCASQGS